MEKPIPTHLENADATADADVLPPKPRRQKSHQILRRKVSRAFSTLTRRSTADLRAESDLSRTITRTEPPPLPSRTATTTTTTTTSSISSTTTKTRTRTTDAKAVVRRERAADAASYSPAYPIVRLDPVLIGCFVCL